jgi:hypothetical protein
MFTVSSPLVAIDSKARVVISKMAGLQMSQGLNGGQTRVLEAFNNYNNHREIGLPQQEQQELHPKRQQRRGRHTAPECQSIKRINHKQR